jgi:hypothetical protein
MQPVCKNISLCLSESSCLGPTAHCPLLSCLPYIILNLTIQVRQIRQQVPLTLAHKPSNSPPPNTFRKLVQKLRQYITRFLEVTIDLFLNELDSISRRAALIDLQRIVPNDAAERQRREIFAFVASRNLS